MKHRLFSRWSRGLMPAVFLSLFVWATAMFVGCDQESPVTPNRNRRIKNPYDTTALAADAQATKLSYQGKLYAREEFQKIFKSKSFPVMVAGIGLPEANVAYLFETEEEFQAWAKTTALAETFARIDGLISEAKQSENKGRAGEREEAGSTILAVNGSVKLRTGYSCSGGTSFTAPYFNANLTPNGLNNNISSLTITNGSANTHNGCILFDGFLYQNARAIFVNTGPTGYVWCVSNLASVGFDNLASSVIIF